MQAVAKEIEAQGARALTYKVDVTKRERVYEVAKQMKAEIGKDVTVLVNNAGIVSGKPFLEGDDAYSLKTMEVNVIAHFWTVKAFLPAMVQMNHGHIITIASTAGLVGVDGLADYCTSKSAAIAFHEGIRTEIRRLKCPGVRMTLVNPYFIDTGMFTGAKTKAPILLPILQPDYVVNSILNAAEKNRNLLVMPRYGYILTVTNGVPALVRDFIYDFMGVGENMADFKQTRTKTLKEQ
jgi:all-trans-retinol dehydrogenase (NAD+)|eukprot:evm.model.NODE_3177_length_20199_cov_24.013615.1